MSLFPMDKNKHLVGGEEAEVEGRVGDDVSLGALGGAGHDLVSQPGGDS